MTAIQARDKPRDSSWELEEKYTDSVSSLLLNNNSVGDLGAEHLVKFLQTGTLAARTIFHFARRGVYFEYASINSKRCGNDRVIFDGAERW